MFGSTGNGNIPATVITGGKDPGKRPWRAIRGNRDTGKTTVKDTDGIRVNGDKDKDYRNRKAPLWAGLSL
jgi:hypothetical protein